MPSAIRAATEREVGAALEQTIEDRLREVAIMHHIAKRRQRFVRREQNRPPLQVPFIDHAIEDIGGVGGVREIPEFVDDEDVRGERWGGTANRTALGGGAG